MGTTGCQLADYRTTRLPCGEGDQTCTACSAARATSSQCSLEGFGPSKPAVAKVLFGYHTVPVCQHHLDQYVALDVDDPECNVREKLVTPLEVTR